jgi:uncharacterized protein YheU (UPF0270 family)
LTSGPFILYSAGTKRKESLMAVYRITIGKLSPEALKGIIDEFISRDGTDYGAIEAPFDAKFRQIKRRLENGSAVHVYDDETETTGIFPADDPLLKKLDP